MRLIVGAGGTGGGIYPAIAILQALKSSDHEILWVGSEGGMESSLVQRAGYRFIGIPSAGLHGVGWRALPGNVVRLLKGLPAAHRVIKEFRPECMLLTGGHVSFSIAIAGRRIPSLLFVPDIEPAQAIKLIAKTATRIAVSTADSMPYFKQHKKVVITGYPTRSELKEMDAAAARSRFNLHTDKRVLVVFGGSQGAQSMNRSLYPQLATLLKRFQIIHLFGEHNVRENDAETDNLPEEVSADYYPFPFLHGEDLSAAFSAADLVISRAGAAVMGEFPLFGLPAILVPYPFAWQYQQINARYLENHGAALVLQDGDMRGSLTGILYSLFDHPETLEKMSNAMRSLANPSAAANIVRHMQEMVNEFRLSPKGRRS